MVDVSSGRPSGPFKGVEGSRSLCGSRSNAALAVRMLPRVGARRFVSANPSNHCPHDRVRALANSHLSGRSFWNGVATTSGLERFQFSLQQGYRQCPESAEGVAGYWRFNINWKRFRWQKPLGIRTKGRINAFRDRNVNATKPLAASHLTIIEINALLRCPVLSILQGNIYRAVFCANMMVFCVNVHLATSESSCIAYTK